MTIPFHDPAPIVSADRRYRYLMTRRWGTGPLVGVIGLNPEGGHGEHAEARRIKNLAKSRGFAGYTAANLYARIGRRDTAVGGAGDPVGPANDSYIDRLAAACDMIVFAWGDHADPTRARAVASHIWHQCSQRGATVAVVGWTANIQPRQLSSAPAGTPLCALTGGANPRFLDVDWRWSQLLADTSGLDSPRSA